MIRSIVLHQINPVAAAVEGGHHDLLQEGQIGFPRKIIFLVQINETGVIETNCAEDLLCVAFSARGDLRLAPPFGPRGMQGGRLAKRSLVFENDHRAFPSRLFFRFG
jgi:hypothetical protein